MFAPKRLEVILEGLVAMQASKDGEMQKRRATLEAELANTNDKIRLYRAIEDGIVGLDDQLEDRIETLKNQRDIVVATLERIVTQARTTSAITPERLQKFSRLMHEKLDTGDVQAKKAYLRSVIAQIEVGDDKVRIFGEKASLAAAMRVIRQKRRMFAVLYANGALGEIRTPDPQIRSLMLYPAELRAHS